MFARAKMIAIVCRAIDSRQLLDGADACRPEEQRRDSCHLHSAQEALRYAAAVYFQRAFVLHDCRSIAPTAGNQSSMAPVPSSRVLQFVSSFSCQRDSTHAAAATLLIEINLFQVIVLQLLAPSLPNEFRTQPKRATAKTK